MKKEIIPSKRSTVLRKNNTQELKIVITQHQHVNTFVINGSAFITEDVSDPDLVIKSESQ